MNSHQKQNQPDKGCTSGHGLVPPCKATALMPRASQPQQPRKIDWQRAQL